MWPSQADMLEQMVRQADSLVASAKVLHSRLVQLQATLISLAPIRFSIRSSRRSSMPKVTREKRQR